MCNFSHFKKEILKITLMWSECAANLHVLIIDIYIFPGWEGGP